MFRLFTPILSGGGGSSPQILATANLDGPTRRAWEQAQQEATETPTPTPSVLDIYGGSSIQEAYERKDIAENIPMHDLHLGTSIIITIILTLLTIAIITIVTTIIIKKIRKKSISKLTTAIIITTVVAITTGITGGGSISLMYDIIDPLTNDQMIENYMEINPSQIPKIKAENSDKWIEQYKKEIIRLQKKKQKDLYEYICTSIILITSIITLFILIIAAIIYNLRFSIKIFKKAMDSDDTKILRPAKLGFWLTVIGTPCIIFFYIPVWLPLLILGRIFTRQADNMLNAYKNDPIAALEKLKMRQRE